MPNEGHRILKRKIKVINIGIPTFVESLRKQGVEVIEVDWKPPAGGDEELLRILEKLKCGP
ncbi:MAG: hypothetical protein QXK88_07995 [Desulfurococcaceae archaeon]